VSVEENMALVRRFLEARGRGDLDGLEHMMAPDFVDQHLRSGVRDDDRRPGHPTYGTRWGGAVSDKRGVDSLERPEPTLRRGGGSSDPGEGKMTPTKRTS
jgi:hypothetical protein